MVDFTRRMTADDFEISQTGELVPSPDRIREMTAEIRSHWTPRERRRRAGIMRFVELMQMPLLPRRKGYWIDPA